MMARALLHTRPAPGWVAPDFTPAAAAVSRASQTLLGLPFDLLRLQYAAAARAGLVQRSMLASCRFDHALTTLEHLSYGPFARSV
jgi:hypothetical protein